MQFSAESKIDTILKYIDNGNYEKAVSNLEIPKEKIAIVSSVLSALNLRSFELTIENAKLKAQIAAFESEQDASADEFISAIVSAINSNTAAFNAQYFYNAQWFANLQFSNVVKVIIAQAILSQVSKYNFSYTIPLWSNIVLNDPEIMDLITFKVKS